MRHHGAGNGQHGVGFAGDACAEKAPAFLCASFGFEGDMGGWREQAAAIAGCRVVVPGGHRGWWEACGGEGDGGDLLAGTLRGFRQLWEGDRRGALGPKDAT